MSRPPLRWMILVPMMAAITVGFGAFAVFIEGVERGNLMADIDAELVRAERSVAARPAPPANESAPGSESTAPRGDDSTDGDSDDVGAPVQLLVESDGQILVTGGGGNPFAEAMLVDLAARSGTFTTEDPRYRVRVAPRDGATVAITALPLELFDDSVAEFRRSILVGGLVILALVSAVVWFLIAAMARPITQMAAAATRIADGALDTEIDAPRGSRETAELADDLDRMLRQLRAVIDDRERSAADATAARDDMQRFLADVSHELRTPLTALKGYSDLYAGDMLGEPGALDRAMARIGNESERLGALVNDMLQLARQAPMSDRTELVDVNDIVEVVVDDLRVAHPTVHIDLDIAVGTDNTVSGQPGQLHQAILNVGSNACQHTQEDSGVQFTVRSTDTDLIIQVSDHGPGIDPDEVDKIFLPFYRHETSRDRDGRGGAGLGLAITHQIVERHHGTITVTSTPGDGAAFTLTVPLAAA